VHELGRPRGGAARQVVHLAEENRVAAPGRVPRDAATVDAATDDSEVENLTHGRTPQVLFIRKILVFQYLTTSPVFDYSDFLSDSD
jgi:hypothetical protein